MSDMLEALPAWLGVGAGGGIGIGAGTVFAVRFLNWLGGRVDKREAAAERASERVDSATGALIKHLQEEIKRQHDTLDEVLERMAAVEAELERCRAERAADQEEMARLRGAVAGLGDARQKAQTALSAERVMDRAVIAIGERIKGDKP